MIQEPKLRTPLLLFVLAIVCIVLVLKVRELPEWVRLFLSLLAVLLGVFGVITLSNWIVFNFSVRLREYHSARAQGLKIVADAVRGLTANQTQAVLAMDMVYISMLAEEGGPVFFIRGLTKDIPYTVFEDYLNLSIDTYPFLLPVRAYSSEAWAQEITNLIVAKGWATKATGVHPAKLTKRLDWVAEKFGIVLESIPAVDLIMSDLGAKDEIDEEG